MRRAAIADTGVAGQVSTLVGKGLFAFGDIDGDQPTARLQHPLGLAHVDGQLYVADTYNDKIKKIDPAQRGAATFVGSGKPGFADGEKTGAELNEPGGLCALDGKLYLADTNNSRIRIVDLKTAAVTTLPITPLTPLPTQPAARP